ncbi:alpha-(1,3)-fucosyltransferase fut-1-like [Physella acuta]|uniref:alpha-(1,3)-fucosyltransferase fut-1-like n=1 Tax=Physella acuta TaxID=109671 RepID=UPI0027DE92EF|nr:alpha-(1,3)-fucosyltransferase fut-1-like [Physella acuta]
MPVTEALLKHPSFSNDSIMEDLIRSGFGLQSYVTETGEEIWTENGVQYRPFPYKEPKDSKYYNSEFEAYIPFNETTFFEGRPAHQSFRNGTKKIILWWQHKVGQASIDGLKTLKGCPEFPCVIGSDRKYTDVSSALLVDAQFVNNEPPPTRREDQVFVHYHVEAPSDNVYWWYGNLYEKYETWNTAFNWTMSFRRDSDIRTYYGLVRKRKHIREKNYTSILASKTRLVAWFVSNCNTNSKREEYVAELQRYLDVDVYGKCGPFRCPRQNDSNCRDKIRKIYKFYIAFENNLCKDYITEKLYKFFDSDFIVIARGSNFYSSNLPSETFINTADFKSPEELAKRILYLDSHDEAYIAMLKEKDKYFSIYEDYPLYRIDPVFLEYRYEAVPMCQLCQRVWNLEKYAKTVPDILAWFENEYYKCQKN